MRRMRSVPMASLCGLWLWATALAAATPQSGLWVIDAEADGRPGRGIQIDARNQLLVATVYGYRADGSAQWYLAAGPFDGGVFQGTLASYEGGTAFGAAVVAAHAGPAAGSLTLSFSDSTHGSVTLPGEPARAISKVVLASAAPRAQLKLEAWADNWFAAYQGEALIGEDHVPITTERSFNSETWLFDASYPLELNLVLKDYKQDDSGLEYIGAPNQQIGDGGFIFQLTDVSSGARVAVSGTEMRCQVIHKAPLNPACEHDPNPLASCQSQILPEPTGWKLPGYDVSSWTPVRTYTEAEVGVKEGYFDIAWDSRARLVWSADLRLDNTLLCKLRIPAPPELPPSSFAGNVVLGAPTSNSIHANVYAPGQSGTVALLVGKAPGVYQQRTPASTLAAGQALDLRIDGLQPNTRYWYRLEYRGADGSVGYVPEASFMTARAPGSAFTFIVQGDSHPERARAQFDATLYQRTLQTAAADQPDFMLMLGDDFSVDTIDPAQINPSLVSDRYALQRPWLGLIGRSAPIYLVNGNHEQAARYLYDGTPNNIAVWAQTARNRFYAQPAPDGFYSGNGEQLAHIGYLRNYYAWTWGDALFVVLDPYWASTICVDEPYGGGPKRSDLWDVTHGEAQYRWLQSTLAQSHARYKFVFAHHVLGTGRGGTDVATRYEWGGGLNNNGTTSGFASNRPGWEAPIHRLMVENGVTIFFQGHDHIFVRQTLDGVTYQSMPEPADPNYSLFNADAYASGDKFPNSGYARVRVAPDGVQVDYVRTWLPADEGPGRVSGSTAYSYRLP